MRRVLGSWRRKRLYRRCLGTPERILVVRYHSVGDVKRVSEYLDPGLSATPEVFTHHLRLLRERFVFRTMDEFESTIANPPAASERRAVFITFDDGYSDNYDTALPLLEAAGANATFYVTTGPLFSRRGLWISELYRLVPRLPSGLLDLDGEDSLDVPVDPADRQPLRRTLTRRLAAMAGGAREQAFDRLARAAGVARGEGLAESFMTSEQVRDLRRRGMLVGAHTRTHPHLALLQDGLAEEETAGSRHDLEEILGEPIEHFSYPNPGGGGAVTEAAKKAVFDAGFRTAVTSVPAPLTATADRLRLPRLGIYAGRQQALLYSLIEELPEA